MTKKHSAVFIFLVICASFGFMYKGNGGRVTLHLDDITPRFIKFFDSASQVNANEAQRWELWKTMYDFAATPPTPAGDSIARKLLDNAWPQYPTIIPLINPAANQKIFNEAKAISEKISVLLMPDSAVEITLRLYVGGFETNAFTTAFNKKIITSVPVEISSATRNGLMIHELVHAVHIGMGSFSGGWKRTIGTIILTEGLAMRASQAILPGKPDSSYTEYTPGWLAEAGRKNNEILQDVLQVVHSNDNADIMNFTMGKGPSGLEREAYYAGWVVVGYWLKHGKTFSQIAHIKENQMSDEVKKTILLILSQ